MPKYISFGQFNKKYFFILGSLIVRTIISFITGFTPYLTPNKTIYIFGFQSNFFSHPMITYCFQYFSLCLGGIILELILRYKEKNNKKEDNNIRKQSLVTLKFSLTRPRASSTFSNNSIYFDKYKSNDCKYFLRIFSVYSLYYFAKIVMNSLDNMGYNRVKYWPLEFIFLYLFSKKIMNKIFYPHQILSLSTLMFICTTIYVINSFIPQSNKDCSSVPAKEFEECDMLSKNIYKDIINKLSGYFIPIFILLYLAAMISNAYSSITSKWLMDIKYITLNRILIYVGAIGLIYSVILLVIFSNVSCGKAEDKILKYVCKLQYEGNFYYDNYRTLAKIETKGNFFIDIFITIPIYIVSSFSSIFFELLIIKDLDAFYLVPIDCAYFLIYEIIDYCATIPLANLYRNLKFACQFCSNFIAVFLASIYLEIIELHFCQIDRHLRRFIIERVKDEPKTLLNKDDESVGSGGAEMENFIIDMNDK